MITMQFDFEGLSDNLNQLSQRVSRRLLREALREAAEPIRKTARQLAPVNPAMTSKVHLRDAMTISNAREEDDTGDQVTIAVGPARQSYWGSFQELGTAFHAAQPFLRPAFDINITTTLRIFAAAMWRELTSRGFSRRSTTRTVRVQHGPGGRFGAAYRTRPITAPISRGGGRIA